MSAPVRYSVCSQWCCDSWTTAGHYVFYAVNAATHRMMIDSFASSPDNVQWLIDQRYPGSTRLADDGTVLPGRTEDSGLRVPFGRHEGDAVSTSSVLSPRCSVLGSATSPPTAVGWARDHDARLAAAAAEWDAIDGRREQ